MVVGFTTTYAISAYHHWCCEFESRSGRDVQHYVIKFVSDLRQFGDFLRVLRFPLPRYNWNIVESSIKHHQTNKRSSGMLTVKRLQNQIIFKVFDTKGPKQEFGSGYLIPEGDWSLTLALINNIIYL